MELVASPDVPKAALAAAVPAAAPPVSDLAAMLQSAGHIDAAGLRRALRVRAKLETPQPLVKTLEEMGLVSRDSVLATVRANRNRLRLGDLLVELGHLRESDLRDRAIA